MRKILFTLCAILLTINASAQYKEFQFGLMGQPGYNWLSTSNENISDIKNNFSYKYGLFGSFFFGENYGISSGIYFINKKASYHYNGIVNEHVYDYTHSFSNTHIQLPIMFKGRTDLIAERLRISGEFGAGFNFLINKSQSFSTIDHPEVNYKTFGTSLIIGLGAEIYLFKTSGLLLQVVFDKDFISLVKTDDFYSPMKMSSLYFEIGFFF